MHNRLTGPTSAATRSTSITESKGIEMRRRLLELIGVVTVIMAVTVLLKLASDSVAGQGQTASGLAEAAPVLTVS